MATDYEEFNAEITAHGNSLTIKCTTQVKRMGLGRGDLVRVRIERIPAKE
ncbi:MAG: hypothetical protein IJI97_00265 [Clostridia bacterium]|nr:hypothetical protein [Clostridia bacterium]